MKRGTPDHPKTRALARMLRINHAWAVGILEMLWHFAAQYAPAGDIGRYSDEEIVEACGWPSDRSAQELIEALIACRWLDKHEEHRLLVHDWSEHADATVHYRLAKARVRFADGKIPSLDGLYSSERKAALETYRSSEQAAPRDCHGAHRGAAEEAPREIHGAHHGDTMALPRRSHGGTTAPPRRNHGGAVAAPRHHHGMPEPLPEPKPEPLAAQNVNSRTPPYPHGTDSPPPLTDPKQAIAILAERRAMEPRQRRPPPQPRTESELAVAVVGRMLCDWMEHRAETLGPPDDALCRRLLEAHGMSLERLRDWLLGLRRRGKHPGSVQSWGWFVALTEADGRRAAEAVAEEPAPTGSPPPLDGTPAEDADNQPLPHGDHGPAIVLPRRRQQPTRAIDGLTPVGHVSTPEADLAELVVARMLTDWTEGRLGQPDRQIVQRILQAHDGELDAVHGWLLGLRHRGKRPESVQSWGWFAHLAEAEAARDGPGEPSPAAARLRMGVLGAVDEEAGARRRDGRCAER